MLALLLCFVVHCKSKETGILQPIFPDYVISCDYGLSYEFFFFHELLEYSSGLVSQPYYIVFFLLFMIFSNSHFSTLLAFSSIFLFWFLWWRWWWIVLAGWFTCEQSEAVFPEGTIVRKPHHLDFPECRGGNQSPIDEIATCSATTSTRFS